MGEFDNITKYLNYLDENDFGKWISDEKGKGTFENFIQMTFISYSDMAINLEKDIYDFVENNKDMNFKHYDKILE